jgi:hypothetical protein
MGRRGSNTNLISETRRWGCLDLLFLCVSVGRRNNLIKHFTFLLLFSNAAPLHSAVFN